jgi:hypothetical protein
MDIKETGYEDITKIICFRMESVRGFYELGNEPLIYTKNREVICGATEGFVRTTLLRDVIERVTGILVSHCADLAFSNK